jgi:hypothetical protein
MKIHSLRPWVLTAAFAAVLAAPAAAEPVAIYKFDEVKDGVVADLSGKGNDANVDGEYKVVDGKDGKSLQFDGETTGVILPEAVLAGDEFTFAVWVNPKTWKDWNRIYDFGAGASGDTWLGHSGISKKLRLDWFTKNANAKIIETKAALPLNKWTHVAVTVDATTVSLYVDGKLVGTSESQGILPNQIPANNFYLGRSNWPDPLFKGRMDEVYIDDKALTADQIKDIAKALPVAKK